MSVGFRQVANTLGTETSHVCNRPAGTVDDDVMLAFVACYDETNLDFQSEPSGWTQFLHIGQPVPDMHVYWKRASSEGSSYTWATSQSRTVSIIIVSYSGARTTGVPILGESSVFGNTLPAMSALPDYGSMRVVAFTDDLYGTLWTPPSGFTERIDHGANGPLMVADRGYLSRDAPGAATGTPSAGTTDLAVQVMLIAAPLSGSVLGSSVLSAVLLKQGELGGVVGGSSELTGDLSYIAALEGTIGGSSELTGNLTGIPSLDFTVYDAYIDDGTDVVGYIFADAGQNGDESLRLQPVRSDVGNNPAEIRPESGDLFAQADFSHGDGQEYFHHESRDPRRFLHSEGYDIGVPGKLTHLHRLISANGATAMGDLAIADGVPFYADGTDLYIGNGLFPGTWTSEDWDVTETRYTITSLASSGSDLYLATTNAAGAGNGIHKRDAAGTWTHYVNDTNSLGFSKIAWVKDRLMAVSGTAVYEITAGGALPTAIETMAPGWVATAIFEAGGFIYICWKNTDSGGSQINHYGLNSGATAIEKKGSTPLPQGQFATGGRGYLNTVFIGVGRLNSDGGYDPVLYQGVADASGVVDYVKIVEETGSGAEDLSVAAICPFGEAIVYGWCLRSGASTGSPREGLGIFHLGLGAHAHYLNTGNISSRKINAIAVYKGRLLVAVNGIGLYYEDPTTFVSQAELVPSVADWSNSGLKVWDRLEVSHRPLEAQQSVTVEFTTKHPDEDDWDGAIVSNTVGSEGANAALATATSRLFDIRIRSNANTALTAAPTVFGFAVRSNPKPAVPEYQLTRIVRLFDEDRKDPNAEAVKQNPDDMRAHLQSLAYRWVKVYEPDTTWTARVISVATVEPQQPKERVTAGEPERSGFIMQIVLSGTRD